MATRPLLIFLHLPKTAGSTLASILERQYGAGRILSLYHSFTGKELGGFSPAELNAYSVVAGHFYFGAHHYISSPFQYVTLLREPIERVISHYHYVRGDPQHYLHPMASRASLGEYVAACGAAEPNNDQTRLLAGVDDPPGSGLCSAGLLPLAIQNLEQCFSVVGLTEEFDCTLILLKRVLGWRLPFYTRQNVSGQRPRRGQLSTKTLEIIRAYNAQDLELYAAAQDLFWHQVRGQGNGFEREVQIFARLNGLYAGLRRSLASLRSGRGG